MKVSEYHKQGLKNRVEEQPEGFEIIGSYQEGTHKITCFAKVENGKIIDAKYTSSKRCKKLMAIADLVCEKLKGQNINNISIDKNEILDFFKEEKEKDKMENRLNIVLKALNLE